MRIQLIGGEGGGGWAVEQVVAGGGEVRGRFGPSGPWPVRCGRAKARPLLGRSGMFAGRVLSSG